MLCISMSLHDHTDVSPQFSSGWNHRSSRPCQEKTFVHAVLFSANSSWVQCPILETSMWGQIPGYDQDCWNPTWIPGQFSDEHFDVIRKTGIGFSPRSSGLQNYSAPTKRYSQPWYLVYGSSQKHVVFGQMAFERHVLLCDINVLRFLQSISSTVRGGKKFKSQNSFHSFFVCEIVSKSFRKTALCNELISMISWIWSRNR